MENKASKTVKTDEPAKTTLFKMEPSGEIYRIPALIYLRHAKTFLAFAEKRSSLSDHDSEVLVMRRGVSKDDGSVEWSSSKELQSATLTNHRTMNPCPVYDKNSKTIFLFFVCIFGKTTEACQICGGINKARLCYVTSKDNGEKWSEVTDLTESVIGDTIYDWATFAVGPGHGIQLANGRLIIPAYAYYISQRHRRSPVSGTVHPYALAIYSEDNGQTWHLGELLRKSAISHSKSCECEMAEIIDLEGRSHLYCNARNIGHKSGHRCEALSENGGISFDEPRLVQELVEPPSGCQGSVISFPAPKNPKNQTQTWLLFMHPTNQSSRVDMGVYLNRSPLQPFGWETPRIINSGPSGYSDLAYNEDKDTFSALMECGEKTELQIAFVTFTLNDFL